MQIIEGGLQQQRDLRQLVWRQELSIRMVKKDMAMVVSDKPCVTAKDIYS